MTIIIDRTALQNFNLRYVDSGFTIVMKLNCDLENDRYLLAIAILSSLYTGGQAFRQIHELSTAKQLLKPRMAAMLDFFGDQV